MEYFFITRHGQTEAQVLRYFQTQRIDKPLTKLGRMQAKKLGERLIDENIGVIIHSPAKRAEETAFIIHDVLVKSRKFSSLLLMPDYDLLEINAGNIEGLKYDKIKEKYPAVYDAWYGNCPMKRKKARFPGGESFGQAVSRAKRFISGRLLFRSVYEGNLLIVSHGGINGIITALLLGIKPEECFSAIHFEECGLLKIKLNGISSELPQLVIPRIV